MTHDSPIASPLKQYLLDALPEDAGKHMLTFGEAHTQTEHLKFLTTHLPELVAQHRLGTIGVEWNGYMSAFIMAYRDHALPVPPEHVADYMRRMAVAYGGAPIAAGSSATADMVMAAIDRGVDVVPFDVRMNFHESKSALTKAMTVLRDAFDNDPSLRERMRVDGAFFREWSNAPENDLRMIFKKGITIENVYGQAFALMEINTLMSKHPSYRDRIQALEAIVKAGRREKMGSEAISAAILTHASDPDKNTIHRDVPIPYANARQGYALEVPPSRTENPFGPAYLARMEKAVQKIAPNLRALQPCGIPR